MEKDFEYDETAVRMLISKTHEFEDYLMEAGSNMRFTVEEMEGGLYGSAGPHTARMNRMLDTYAEKFYKLQEWALRMAKVMDTYEAECDAVRREERDKYDAFRLIDGSA